MGNFFREVVVVTCVKLIYMYVLCFLHVGYDVGSPDDVSEEWLVRELLGVPSTTDVSSVITECVDNLYI